MSEYKRIRTLFPDHLSMARGKYIAGRLINEKARFCITTFALNYDRDLIPTATSRMLEGLPDVDLDFDNADVRPSWDPDEGVVIGDLFYHGEPVMASPRHILKKAIADWKELGYDVTVGLELEAIIMQSDENGGWAKWDVPGGYVYGTGLAVDPIGLMKEIWDTAESVGIPMESLNSEYDPPQYELTLRYDDALKAVDNLFLFKLLAREVAIKHGLRLTFMGKPFGDMAGNGLHVNMSLFKDGQNIFHDPNADDGLAGIAKSCIAGLVARHEALAAICAPTVNSYKRLQPAQLAGYWANWGYDHRGVTIRVPHSRGKATRIEHRMADGAAEPYMTTAAVLQAARLGYVNKIELPAAEELDCFESQSTDRGVPSTLLAACDALEADTEFVEAFGAEGVETLTTVKRYEWEKYTTAVPDWESQTETITDWEHEFYLAYL